ncbi:MAG TPA: cytochrome c [Verrucomicrobiae bacterium]|nr:cytochrome c [Verrucomicrobiae bacterium]
MDRRKGLLWKLNEKLPALLVLAVLVGGAVIFVRQTVDYGDAMPGGKIKIPEFTEDAKLGAVVFKRNCAACHGQNAAGGPGGPPLIHQIYNPGHHSDDAIRFAIRRGAPQHHWRFGNMPAQPQVSASDIENVIRYVRELQRANGIHYQMHKM